nr:MAG TPA_asm: hypothetical protein [Caudoviricetes sp.]
MSTNNLHNLFIQQIPHVLFRHILTHFLQMRDEEIQLFAISSQSHSRERIHNEAVRINHHHSIFIKRSSVLLYSHILYGIFNTMHLAMFQNILISKHFLCSFQSEIIFMLWALVKIFRRIVYFPSRRGGG